MTPPAAPESPAPILVQTLLEPDLDDERVLAGIRASQGHGVASVRVRPCDIDLAIRSLDRGELRAGAVCGFPHGSHSTATKLFEARDLLRRGAREIAAVIGISRLLNREFQHVQSELLQLRESCQKESARLTVILETAYLTEELKVIACSCCERAEVDFVSTSTGFGPAGYTLEDLKLLRRHLPEEVGIEAAGGIDTLGQVLELRDFGCARIATSRTTAILDEWTARHPAKTYPGT
jgi:deoxyribose-phosphate aldolase